VKQKHFGKIAGYVMQDDILFAYFSPREALRFAAALKLNCSVKKQHAKVEEILKELQILHVGNTMVGSQQKKLLSGGERKRTAIGVELITDPSLLILDEPTSGLDSHISL